MAVNLVSRAGKVQIGFGVVKGKRTGLPPKTYYLPNGLKGGDNTRRPKFFQANAKEKQGRGRQNEIPFLQAANFLPGEKSSFEKLF